LAHNFIVECATMRVSGLKIEEFLQLNAEQRAVHLWEEGVYLSKYASRKKVTSLYSLYSFFVEVIISDKQITEIVPFKDGQRLDKYLDGINLRNLW
jgi:hypothetical protein